MVTDLVTRSVDLAEVKKIHPKLEDIHGAKYFNSAYNFIYPYCSLSIQPIPIKSEKICGISVKEYNEALYYRLRFRTLSGFTYLPGKIGTSLTIGGYRLAKKVYRFQ